VPIKVGVSSGPHRSLITRLLGLWDAILLGAWVYMNVSAVSVSSTLSAGIEMGRSSVQETLRII
jgi:hypothetical protein